MSSVRTHKNLYLIGLTGNIACGKSTVLALLRELGAATIDADAVTHTLQRPGEEVYRRIIEAFGEQILEVPGGPIDRRALGTIVFSDPEALRRLEQIIHPAVRERIWAWLDSLTDRRVAVIDAIKLLESGWRQHCDAIWVVTCPPEQQLARLTATRGMTEAEARRRIEVQSPQSEKIALADVVIDNGGAIEATRRQVEAAWNAIPIS